MKNKLLIALLILFISIGVVSAGNNTTSIDNPTTVYSDSNQTITALENGDSNISFSNGFKGYCVEWGEHSAEENETFYVEDTSKIINKETHKDVSNYLKTMFLFFYDRTQENPIATQHMIWKFTDNKEFSRFDKNWYNNIVYIADRVEIPDTCTIKINETHEMVFEFRCFVAKINEYQNYFGYKFFIKEISSQIINSTINNLTTNSTTIDFNDTNVQYNETYIIKNKEKATQSISLAKNITGFKFDWMIFCIIILVIACLVTYRED